MTAAVDAQRRLSGLTRLYGGEAVARICQSHVAVIGIGGVGSWAAEALVRSGVQKITLVDMDHIAESNINRQIHALQTTIGQAKVIAMQKRLQLINPACHIHIVDDFVTPANWPQILPFAVDGVIDACDQLSAKYAMACWAVEENSRRQKQQAGGSGPFFIAAGAAGGKCHAHKVSVADLAQVTHDPLLAKLRYQLRREHRIPAAPKKTGIECVFSTEPVSRPAEACNVAVESSLNCHGYGSLVSVTATFGFCAAGSMLQKLAQALKC